MSEVDPHPPKELEASMRSALNDNPFPTANDLLDGAERMLDSVLRTDCEARSSALDLLTVDALMTRALEIAARNPSLLEEFPEQAMRRIASRAKA
ncbi:MAG: hypothetical protein ACXWND_16420 [Gemmatimonadaceae bacterium]